MTASRELADQLRKRQIAGILILLGIVAAASIYRTGLSQVYPHGWWHIW